MKSAGFVTISLKSVFICQKETNQKVPTARGVSLSRCKTFDLKEKNRLVGGDVWDNVTE